MNRQRVDLLPDHLANADGVPRVVSRAEALTLGFTAHAIEHRLATRRWHLVLPRTYLTGSTLTWSDRVDAALSFAGPNALLTGAAALADLGLRCVSRPDRMLLLVPRGNRVRSTGWVRIRRTDRMPTPALLPGPRRAHPARAVADLSLERSALDDVRTLVAQARRAGLCSLDELWEELVSGPRRHSANLRRALEDVEAGAWSAPEARVATILRRAHVPPFEQNADVELRGGDVCTVDFLWRELRAVLEVDSDRHHWDDPVDRDATTRRHSMLETAEHTVMSRRPGLVRREPRQFRRDVEAWLAARAAELGR